MSKGRKVTSVKYLVPNDRAQVKLQVRETILLVATNDNRIRLYNTEDFSMIHKFRGIYFLFVAGHFVFTNNLQHFLFLLGKGEII